MQSACLLLAVGCASSGDPDSTPGSTSDVTTNRPAAKSGSRMHYEDEELRKHSMRSLLTTIADLQVSIDQIWSKGGDLYITSSASGRTTLFKLDGETLLTEWTYDLQGPLEFEPSVFEYPGELSSENVREIWLVENNRVYGLDDNEGLLIYEPIEVGAAVSTAVAADPSRIYVGTESRRLFCYAKNSGVEQWSHLANGFITANPTVGTVNVYFADDSGSVFKLNAGGGWRSGDSAQRQIGGRVVAEPAFYVDRLYLGSHDYKVYCFEEYQLITRWEYPAGAPITGVIPFRDDVYALSVDERRDPVERNLHCLSRATGDREWERRDIVEFLAADPDFVYARNVEGNLERLRTSDGTTASTIDLGRVDFVVGQDAENGAVRANWGKIFLATRDGRIQAVLPAR